MSGKNEKRPVAAGPRGDEDEKSVGDRSVAEGARGVKSEEDPLFLEKCQHFFREYDLPLICSSLTDPELRVFQFLALFDQTDRNNDGDRKGWVRVSRETIAKGVHKSKSRVTQLLQSLENKGFLQRELEDQIEVFRDDSDWPEYLDRVNRAGTKIKIFLLQAPRSSNSAPLMKSHDPLITSHEPPHDKSSGSLITSHEGTLMKSHDQKSKNNKRENERERSRRGGGRQQPSAAPSPSDSPLYGEYIRLRREKTGKQNYLPINKQSDKMRADIQELESCHQSDDLLRYLHNYFEDEKPGKRSWPWNWFNNDPMEWNLSEDEVYVTPTDPDYD